MQNIKYLQVSLSTLSAEWINILSIHSVLIQNIDSHLCNIAKTNTIYPQPSHIFQALHKTDFDKIKVVILGQDPYHGEDQANGFAFMVNEDIVFPPSLKNIIKELYLEYPQYNDSNIRASLDSWSTEGVLLLNSSLAVIHGQANSLANIGFEIITDHIIAQISTQLENCVFILWGNYAKSKATLININNHLVLQGVHPSPLSAHRGFIGCNHFRLANEYLVQHNKKPINWLF